MYTTKTPRKTRSAPPTRWKQRVDDEMKKNENVGTGNNDGDEDDGSSNSCPKRNWTVKRILSNESFRRENPDSDILTSTDTSSTSKTPESTTQSTLPKTIDEEGQLSNHNNDRKDVNHDHHHHQEEEEEEQEKRQKRSWTVKRILSNNSFLRENPTNFASSSSDDDSALDTDDNDDDDGCDHHNNNTNDPTTTSSSSPKKSWTPKRVMTNDEYWAENKSMASSKSSMSSSTSLLSHSSSLHGDDRSNRGGHGHRSKFNNNSRRGHLSLDAHTTHGVGSSYQQTSRWTGTSSSTSRNGGGVGNNSHKNNDSTTMLLSSSSLLSKTSHQPLKKPPVALSTWKHHDVSPTRGGGHHHHHLPKASINSRFSEDSSDCGLDLGNNTTHSTSSFASGVSGTSDDEYDDGGDNNEFDEYDIQVGDVPPVVTPKIPKKKGSLANRIHMFEQNNNADARGGGTGNKEATRTTRSILSPRHGLDDDRKETISSSQSTYGRSPGALRPTLQRGSDQRKLRAPVGPPMSPAGADVPSTPKASNSKKVASRPKGSSSLQDRIGMFNKNSTLPEFMTIGSSPKFGVKKLVAKPSSKRPSRRPPTDPKRGAISRDDNKPEMTLKDLLPPPKMSLDAENNQSFRKMDKSQMSVSNTSFNASFNRRGRLKATKSALLGKNDESKRDIFTAITAPRMDDLSDFQPPVYKKDPESIDTIHCALRRNFVFDEMEDADRDKFVNAFEEVVVQKGQTIIKQGDAGDFFYVIAQGEVSFHVNNCKVGTTGKGNSFGEMSLLYTCPRAATVIAESSSTRLYRVDQRTFRFMMHSQTKESEEKKKKLLNGIQFLKQLDEADLLRLSSVMTPCMFSTGDYIVKRGEVGDRFYIIHEGKVRVTDIVVGNNRYEDITLENGDYFGEGALISSEARSANVVALTKGTAFSIDRLEFQRVLGDFVQVIRKAQDHRRLEGIKVLREADISIESMDELASLLVDKSFNPKQTVFVEGKHVDHALYLVREGSVTITTRDGSRKETVGPGGFFGQEQLLADVKGKATKAEYTAVAGNEVCVCSVLTLKKCRTVFDTTAMEDCSYRGRSSLKLQRRSSIKKSINEDLSMEKFEKISVLGEGQFAEVWLVQCDVFDGGTKERGEFALKIQDCTDESREGAREAIKREIMILQQLKHPYIIDLVSTFEKDDGTSYMLMEAIHGGELWSVVHREDDNGEWTSGLEESHAKFYALLLADALAYMHREWIVFRDLKPENVLIDDDGWPIIIDCGFAKHVPKGGMTFTFCGTPNYLAPEIVANKGHGKGVDHWALGIVTYEMITGENPFYFEDMDQMALFQAIVQEPFFPLTEEYSPALEVFLTGLLEKDPIHRLGSLSGRDRDILKHEWFSDLDLDKLRNKEGVKAPWVPSVPK